MPEHGQKERVTIEVRDEAALAEVRANVLTLVREKKGLSSLDQIVPDIDILSGPPNSSVIDNAEIEKETKVIPITSKLPADKSGFGLSVYQQRVKKIELKKAA